MEKTHLRRGIAIAGLLLMTIATSFGCGSGGSEETKNVHGVWSYHTIHSETQESTKGTINFKKDGLFEVESVYSGGGNIKGGGDYSYNENFNEQNNILHMNYSWTIDPSGERLEHDGMYFEGLVDSNKGLFTLIGDEDNPWTIEISR